LSIDRWTPAYAPAWFDEAMNDVVVGHSERQRPLEVFGLFLRTAAGRYLAWPVEVRANVDGFLVLPQDLIRVAYLLEQQERTVVGTFHSHPGGVVREMSTADGFLVRWGSTHALCIYDLPSAAWTVRWFRATEPGIG